MEKIHFGFKGTIEEKREIYNLALSLGWRLQEKIFDPNRKLYFNYNKEGNSLQPKHFWNCDTMGKRNEKSYNEITKLLKELGQIGEGIQQLSRVNIIKAIGNLGCSTIDNVLEEILKDNLTNTSEVYNIDPIYINRLYKEGSKTQIEYFEKLGITNPATNISFKIGDIIKHSEIEDTFYMLVVDRSKRLQLVILRSYETPGDFYNIQSQYEVKDPKNSTIPHNEVVKMFVVGGILTKIGDIKTTIVPQLK